jgi:endoribonuclease Nob1
MRSVLDSSAFFTTVTYEGELYTASSVISELRDFSSKARFDLLLESGLQVLDPDRDFLRHVRENSVARGEADVLSTTDIDVLALALQLQAAIVSDDYALQNVARSLNITVIPIQQKGARNIRWKFRCSGCGRYYRGSGVCQVCGALIQRKLK